MLFDTSPSIGSIALFVCGWTVGWLLLWRLRPLPRSVGSAAVDAAVPDIAGAVEGATAIGGRLRRAGVAVVVPARNEQGSIGALVDALVGQLSDSDELVVVDDSSQDGTAAVALGAGARVVSAPPLPQGWAGKPHACWIGAQSTTAPILVFLDADVRPAPDLIDRLAGAVSADAASGVSLPNLEAGSPEPLARRLVSMQPWHDTGGRWYESFSCLFNITALMGVGSFTVGGGVHRPTPLAFGPVLACERRAYEARGGHGHPTVRNAVTEDIALGRLFTDSRLFTGSPDTTFRMYPNGARSLVEGWTKNIAGGASSANRWAAVGAVAWVWSLAGGWLASPWFYAASLIQVVVQARRVGRYPLWSSIVFPLGVAVFVAIFVRSAVMTTLRRPVRWKGRSVASR